MLAVVRALVSGGANFGWEWAGGGDGCGGTRERESCSGESGAGKVGMGTGGGKVCHLGFGKGATMSRTVSTVKSCMQCRLCYRADPAVAYGYVVTIGGSKSILLHTNHISFLLP
jgi:hypothetical protein